MRLRRLLARVCSGAILVVLVGHSGSALNAQATDFDGLITTENWLVLGPFTHSFGCDGPSSVYLGNHIAPSHIACQHPLEGDEIEYDEAEAVSDAYVGPDDVPVWRIFDEFGGGLGDINLDTDVTGDQSNVMSWLVTYVDYMGDGPTTVDLCVGSDDAVQVWIDGSMVHNHAICRGRGTCQDTVSGITIEPGVHRIAMAIWEAGGGWGGSLGLRQNGAPIIDGETDDWEFLGVDGSIESPEVCFPVRDLECTQAPDGGAELTWTNPPDSSADSEIQIVSGDTTKTVSGDSTSATLEEDELAADGSICVVNASGTSACCRFAKTDENGFINSGRWLAVGPFSHSFDCGTGSGNHIAPSLVNCEYPARGDELKSGYDPLEASTNGVHPAAPQGDDGPVWYVWNDGMDDGTLNLDQGPGGNLDLHMQWVATYVEYVGDAPIDINLCVGSDDGVQIWINNKIVHDNSVCRGQSLSCQDTVPVTLEEDGLYCIRAGIWENGGGWKFSLALQDQFGAPIVDGDPDWIFHGTRRPEGFEDMIVNPERPDDPTGCAECTDGVSGVTCEFGQVGFAQGLKVSWTSPEGCDCPDETQIRVNGEIVSTVSADADSVDIPESRLGDPPYGVNVMNCSGVAGSCSWPSGITGEGFVQNWLHLGPFAQEGGANPGCDLMQMDHLTDGEFTELDIEPKPGDQIETDYLGDAASTGLNPAEACADCNPDGIPTWHAFRGIGDQFNVNTLVSGGDNQMSYGMFYVDVQDDVTVDIGVASDDGIQVLAAPVGDEMVELHCNSVARGGGGANSVQDFIPGVELTEGLWKFMVKVFEGGGGHNWRFRFERNGQPFLPGSVRLDPGGGEPPPGALLRPGDVNGDASFNMADMVTQLGFLFTGGTLPECYVEPGSDPIAVNQAGLSVLDYNGDGSASIADAVAGLGGLFSGGGPHALGEDCVEIEGNCAPNCVD